MNNKDSYSESAVPWQPEAEEFGRMRARPIRSQRPRPLLPRPPKQPRRPIPRRPRPPWLIDYRAPVITEPEPRSEGGEYVRWIQNTLNQGMGLRLPVNGIMNVETRSAIRSFQEKNGLPITGIVGPDTERALMGTRNGRPSAADITKPDEPSITEPTTQSLDIEFEMARPKKRKSAGTDCGRSGAPAALVSQPGGRCIGPTPPICPPVPGILSEQAVSGIPFEYVAKVGKAPTGNRIVVTRRLRPRIQKYLPSVHTALSKFIANMNRFGLPIEAILTMGSYCCRCIGKTNILSNHSHGDAFDLVGVRWAGGRGETISHNWNTAERALLRRINACLRLSFPTVIDYHRADHRDHFHCDMNNGNPRNPRRRDTLRFVQEALSLVLRRSIPVTGKLDTATQRALVEFGRTSPDALKNSAQFNEILDRLFTIVASHPGGTLPAEGELIYEANGATANVGMFGKNSQGV